MLKTNQPQPAFEASGCYVPLVQISDPAITHKLVKIAQEFSFLDQVFAECFRGFEHAYNHDAVSRSLTRIKGDIVKRQSQNSDPRASKVGYIGYLGEFCENIFSSWSSPASSREAKPYKSGLKYGNDCVIYLQDTLEIPYWQFIIDLFLDWRGNNASSILGTAMLHMLRHQVSSLGDRADDLAQLALLDTKDKDGLEILVRSIRKRMNFLHDALEVAMPDEGLEVTVSVMHDNQVVQPGSESAQCTAPVPAIRVRHCPWVKSQYSRINVYTRLTPAQDALYQLAFFVTFIILAIIPGYQGFSIAAKSNELGSATDADFYFLMQSSIMSILGDFATAQPILQSVRAAWPAQCFWAFSAVGFLSAVISVVIYPLTNTSWSSLVAFMGAVASAASVLVLTIATARQQMAGPGVRNDKASITEEPADRSGKLKVL